MTLRGDPTPSDRVFSRLAASGMVDTASVIARGREIWMDDHTPQRLIGWTGERCVPWTGDHRSIYQHYHRYALAARFTAGRRVLDLGSGEGFGAAMLARHAEVVVGVDVDPDATAHARTNYPGRALRFETGSITDESLLSDEPGFDVITCFDALVHVEDHAAVLRLIRARLASGGLVLVSTPDGDVPVDSWAGTRSDPFRRSELGRVRLEQLLETHFRHVAVLKQHVSGGSLIVPADPGDPDTEFEGIWAQTITRAEEACPAGDVAWSVQTGTPHSDLVALAADRQLPPLPSAATLLDAGDTEQPEPDGELRAQRDSAIADAARLHQRHQREQAESAGLKDTVAELERRRADAQRRADRAETELDRTAAELHRLRRDAERDRVRVHWLRDTAAQLERRAVAAENWTDADLRAATPESAQAPVSVPYSAEPVVSVVIPVYGQWADTRRCLLSLAERPGATPFEVIVVDDASPDSTSRMLNNCPGVRLVRTEQNQGFIGAANRGAQHACAPFLVLLNNDTEVRDGWLDELVAATDADESIGLVGAALLHGDDVCDASDDSPLPGADGAVSPFRPGSRGWSADSAQTAGSVARFAECGGIIWSDGTAWRYGRGAAVDSPECCVLRDVDYCSSAALLVRTELFGRLGGFDERYAPGYYEDADLAFALRAAGYRTVVQPAAHVVHHERQSHGAGDGLDEHRELNRRAFVAKWADVLEAAHLPGSSARNLWLARHRGTRGHRAVPPQVCGQGGSGLVLVVDQRVPQPDHDSASVRMRRLLEVLVELGRRVVFFPVDHVASQPYTAQLQQLGVTVLPSAQLQHAFLREAGATLSLAVLSRPHVGWHYLEQLRTHAPQCTAVYDTVDVQFVRLDRQAALAEHEGRADDAAAVRSRAHAARELELGLLRSCDVTTVVSGAERAILGELEPAADIRVLSNVHDVRREPVSPRGRTGVVFVGGFDHPPNVDAAVWAAREIMPRVREHCPEAVLHIVGSNPGPDVLALAGDGVEIHGWVPDLEPVYARARVAVAPLRFGAGVKGKVGASLAAGVPTVGTALAVEGMHLTPEEDILLAEDATGLARAVTRLLTDDSLWRRIADAGRARVAEQFGPTAARHVLRGLV